MPSILNSSVSSEVPDIRESSADGELRIQAKRERERRKMWSSIRRTFRWVVTPTWERFAKSQLVATFLGAAGLMVALPSLYLIPVFVLGGYGVNVSWNLVDNITGFIRRRVVSWATRQAAQKMKDDFSDGVDRVLGNGNGYYLTFFVLLGAMTYWLWRRPEVKVEEGREGIPYLPEPVCIKMMRYAMATTALIGTMYNGVKVLRAYKDLREVFNIYHDISTSWDSICGYFTEKQWSAPGEKQTLKQKKNTIQVPVGHWHTYFGSNHDFYPILRDGKGYDLSGMYDDEPYAKDLKHAEYVDDESSSDYLVFDYIAQEFEIEHIDELVNFKDYIIKVVFPKLKAHKWYIALLVCALIGSVGLVWWWRKRESGVQSVTSVASSVSEEPVVVVQKEGVSALISALTSAVISGTSSGNSDNKSAGPVQDAVLLQGPVQEGKGNPKRGVSKGDLATAPPVFTPYDPSIPWADYPIDDDYEVPLPVTQVKGGRKPNHKQPNISATKLGLLDHYGYYFGKNRQDYIDYSPTGKPVVINDASRLSTTSLKARILGLHKALESGTGLSMASVDQAGRAHEMSQQGLPVDSLDVKRESIIHGKQPMNVTKTKQSMASMQSPKGGTVCNASGLGNYACTVQHVFAKDPCDKIVFGGQPYDCKNVVQLVIDSKRMDMVRLDKPTGMKSFSARKVRNDPMGEPVSIFYWINGEEFSSSGRIYSDGSHTCSTVAGACGALLISEVDNCAVGMHYLGNGMDNSPSSCVNWSIPFTDNVLQFFGVNSPKN